ncbi:recombinase family protein [Lacticaseibacillus paracasei]|uniref:recombinase family protein n=1 Tax=Lacticaseibacillus paracasei TaxID=1597 RepID=UPI0021A3CF12|nr:recombinase family protein [Lacticaseibacillus paracasei]MCT3316917.1 recombinase family protein [Lacticaseibacillus paracasei]
MKIGYARVSTRDQNLARQIEQLHVAGVKRIFAEKKSGKDTNRPQLNALLQYIHDDDEVVVVSLERLGRNSEDLTTIIEKIKKAGAVLNILDLPTFDSVTDRNLKALLTNLVLEIQKYTAENERQQILERQRQGIKLAKARGVYKGRQREYSAESKNPQKKIVYERIVAMLQDRQQGKQIPITTIAKENGVSRNTVYKISREIQGKEAN